MRLLTMLAALLVLPVSLLAQGGPEAVDPTTTPFDWYASKAGVIGMTILLTSVAKRLLGNVDGLKAVPTWLYAVVIAAVLTYVTVVWWQTLPGEIGPMISEILLSAGSASGFYEWVNHINKPLAASARSSDSDNMTIRPHA